MYWPIGAPRIYEQQISSKLTSISYDGLDNERRNRKNKSADRRLKDGAGSVDSRSASTDGVDEKLDRSGQEPHRSNTPGQGESNNTSIVDDGSIICLRVPRNGHTFATITSTTLTVWQTKPTAVLSSVVRSRRSLETYGPNVSLLLRPEADVLVLQTARGFLITYSFSGELDGRSYELQFADGGRQTRRRSIGASNKYGIRTKGSLLEGGGLVREATLHFRMVIKLDAGISKALALDHELVIITTDPPAVQCIRWSPDRGGSQTSTELLSNMAWLEGNKTLADIVYDRPMNIFAFVSIRGRAYAVQRKKDSGDDTALFDGHIFHTPSSDDDVAVKAAINSRFSLIALGCRDGSICLFSVRDYAGGVKLLRKVGLPVSSISAGRMTTLCYSPDGYHLFVGYENGWMTWSVYGHPGATSFGCDSSMCSENGERWLASIQEASWVGGGSDLLILEAQSSKFWMLEFARSAVTGCFSAANISRGLLQTSTGLIVYQGDQMSDLTTIAGDVSLWQHVEVPPQYLTDQWPLRSAVISPDSRYIAIAGQRGLAHYSISSGRWRTFTDVAEENDFLVRGGMCWHHHILIAAVETSASAYELRVYSRELALEDSKALHVTALSAPVVHLAMSTNDSILVYDYENSLDHYIIVASKQTVELVKVGQIALHGIIRAPPRVRAVSWIVPDYRTSETEETLQDVSIASVFFLVDGKLVLLQPSTNESGELKYEMRLIAQHVEYFMVARDNPAISGAGVERRSSTLSAQEDIEEGEPSDDLTNSLWIFDGQDVKVCPDVMELLTGSGSDMSRNLDAAVKIPVDFYPLAALLPRGIIMGAEAELIQRRDSNFTLYRAVARTTLFLPAVLQYYLAQYDSSVALRFCRQFQHLPYFSHALEVLLHQVLDEEVEQSPDKEASHLPTVLSFLSTFPEFLEVVVQCTRKTELRSWRTLFAYLPPPKELFETSLQSGALKTAGGYLLVLHTLAEITSTSPQVIRLLRAAKVAEDWELCKELARFLVALDATGSTLKEALELVDVGSPTTSRKSSRASIDRTVPNGYSDYFNGPSGGFIHAPASSTADNSTP